MTEQGLTRLIAGLKADLAEAKTAEAIVFGRRRLQRAEAELQQFRALAIKAPTNHGGNTGAPSR